MQSALIFAGMVFIFLVAPIAVFGFIAPRLEKKRALKRIPHTQTEAELRTQKAMEAAIRNTQQSPPAAAPASLSTRLAQLDEAMKAGQLTEQEYAKARAAILASP